MICKKYSDLSPFEKILYIGKLTHACMNDDSFYEMGDKIINKAQQEGVFENVKILPENQIETNDTEI